VEFERAGKALRLEEEVRELNAFLTNVAIGNATHYYFIRGFNEGNFEHPYTWTRGGRWYSQGGVHKPSYQQLGEEERARITLDGDASRFFLRAALPNLPRKGWAVEIGAGDSLAGEFGQTDLAPKFYPIQSSLRLLDLPGWAVVATGAGAEPSA
jgi:hypothetical protein